MSCADATHVHIRYASDESGSRFSDRYEPGLNYIAILANKESQCAFADFEGKWVRFIGERGYAGQDGRNGTSFISGVGAPNISSGQNGDTYLDLAGGAIYRLVANQWVYTGASMHLHYPGSPSTPHPQQVPQMTPLSVMSIATGDQINSKILQMLASIDMKLNQGVKE